MAQFSLDEVLGHNTKGDLWVLFGDSVLDISQFSEAHPGGFEILIALAGKDIQEQFTSIGHSARANALVTKLTIGKLKSQELTVATTGPRREYPGTDIHVWTDQNFPFPIAKKLTMTMALRPTEEWILIDQNFKHYLSQKYSLLTKMPGKVFYTSSLDTRDAGKEILELFKHHLPKRYPSIYSLEEDSYMVIKPMNTTIDLSSQLHPLDTAARLVQEDVIVMKQNEEGKWVFAGGSVAFPSGWNVSEKIGRVLDVVHKPVPTLNHNMGDSIQRYFTNMKPSTCYAPTHVRYNWNLEVDATLRIPKGEEGSLKDHKLEDLYLRLERQTLRKLPRSKAICFTVGILLWPLSSLLAADPAKREILLEHLKDDSFSEYRSYHRKYRDRDLLIQHLQKDQNAKL